MRRYLFPLAVVAFLVAVGAFLYAGPQMTAPSASPGPRSTAASNAPLVPPNGNAPPDTAPAILTVQSSPTEAWVMADGDTLGTTPLERHPIEAGVYIVSVSKPNHFDRDTILVLRSSQPAVYAPQLQPSYGLSAPSRTASRREYRGPVRDPAPSAPPEAGPVAPDPSATTPETTRDTTQETPSDSMRHPRNLGDVRISSTPDQAAVRVDGLLVGYTPLRLRQIPVGIYEVVATRSGYDTLSTRMEVASDTERSVHLTLQRQRGRLRILVRPWGSIYVDGELHRQEADVWYETEVVTGPHEVMAVHPVLGRQSQRVVVTKDRAQSVVFDLQPDTDAN